MSDLLTVKELAAELRMSVWTVYRKANTGEIPGIRFGKRGVWRFDLEDVRAASTPKPHNSWEQPSRARKRVA